MAVDVQDGESKSDYMTRCMESDTEEACTVKWDDSQGVSEEAMSKYDGLSLSQLREKRNTVSDRLDAYYEKPADKLTAADRQAAKRDERDYKVLSACIDRATSISSDHENGRRLHQQRQNQLQTSNGRRVPAGQLGNPREGFESDPKRGFKDHRDFLTNVMQATTLGRLDNRLKSLVSTGSEALAAGNDEHGTSSDPYGGFFVPVAFSPEQLRLDPESDPMAGLVRSIPMTTPSISFNARVDKNHSTSVSGGLRVYRRKETQVVNASRMEHEQVELKAGALFGVAHASEELLARSLVSFIALLDAGFSDEFTAKLVNERLNGTGTGEFEGVLNSPAKITVDKESGQAGGTIVKNNIDNMRTRCWRYGSAIWLANHGTLPQLRGLVQVIGTGGIAVPYFTTTPEGQAMLDGRPLHFTEFCPALGTEGDLLLSNWSEYLEGTLTSQQSAESMHVRFLEHERTFKFWMENDAKCWWRSALTPKNGPTRSPIVTLQTR